MTVPDEDNFSVEIPVDSTAQEVLVSIVGELTATTVSIVNPKGKVKLSFEKYRFLSFFLINVIISNISSQHRQS